LYDQTGLQLGQNRHYKGTDALLDVTLPADGDYLIRLFEFTHTVGTPEHFYRLSVTTAPWIDAVFPDVIEPGKTANVTVYGRNLPGGKPDPSAVVDGKVLETITVPVTAPADPAALLRLDPESRPPTNGLFVDNFTYRLRNAAGVSNAAVFGYARAPVVLDNGDNDTPDKAQAITLPCEIAGHVEKKRDRDWYSFTAKKGDVLSFELLSERVGAPTDMYFALRNPEAKQDLGEYDDDGDTLSPLKPMTRSEDPARLRFVAPADARYLLLVASRHADTQAGPSHSYRLRIGPEQPDFRLVALAASDANPDACTVQQGGHRYWEVFAFRRDGFAEAITLTVEGLPNGVTSVPQTLGPGLKHTSLVVSAAGNAPTGQAEVKIKGTATIQGQAVVREARPVEVIWPVTPGQGIPPLLRLVRGLPMAVRQQAPYTLTATLDKANVIQGDKATLNVKLARLWPDFKQPLNVAAVVTELPANLTVNNNQPLAIAPDKTDGALPIVVNGNVAPGTYNIVVRGTAQIPYNKDPKAAQKPPTNVIQPATAVTLTVVPKTLGTLTVALASPTLKIGTQTQLTVKVARQFGYAGEFKVQVVLPANAKGVTADAGAIAAGSDEVKLVVRAAADAAPVNLANVVVKAVALFNGTAAVEHQAMFNVNVVK
jgi:hypothetical protein